MGTIQLERTTDYRLLTALLRGHAELYYWISDDFSPSLEEASIIEHPDLWYVLARDPDGDLMGFFRLAPQTGICWELHTVMRLNGKALEAMKALFEWLWQRTKIVRIVTNMPSFNRVAQCFARRAGLRQYGLNEKSYRKDGQNHDQILFGITRPGV